MKFNIAAVVMCALILGAQSSVIPIGHHHGIATIGGPTLLSGHVDAISLAHGPTLIAGHVPSISLTQGPAIIAGHVPSISLTQGPSIIASHVPAISLTQGPAVAVASSPAVIASPVIAGEGQYVAKTRGAIHTAPLAGHINSASSINLQPAPGTI